MSDGVTDMHKAKFGPNPTIEEPVQINPQIKHPDYYNQGKIEVIDFIEDQGHLGFCRQTAIKYICRSGKKAGSSKEHDLKKAIYYLEREMGHHHKGE